MTSVVKHTGEGPAKLIERKHPNDVLDYRISWQNELGATESIASREWTTDGVFTIDSSTYAASEIIGGTTYNDVETVWLSGGTKGKDGTTTEKIVTDEGRTLHASFIVRCDIV